MGNIEDLIQQLEILLRKLKDYKNMGLQVNPVLLAKEVKEIQDTAFEVKKILQSISDAVI